MQRYAVAILWSLILVVCSCKQQREFTPKEEHYAPIEVVLKLETNNENSFLSKSLDRATSMTVSSPAIDYALTKNSEPLCKATPKEDLVNDLNVILIYRIDASSAKDGIELRRQELNRHYYFNGIDAASKEVRLEDVYIGEYDMYIIANNGANLCTGQPNGMHDHTKCKFKTELDVEKATTDKINFTNINRPNNGPLMAYKDHVVLRTYGQYNGPEIVLTRIMSQLNMSINSIVEINDIQIIDLAADQVIYGSNENPSGYSNFSPQKVYVDGDKKRINTSSFISSNIKGNIELTNIEERLPNKAPLNATHLLIGGYSEYRDSYIGNIIYLWHDDKIKNFDIKQNTQYNLLVEIKDTEIADKRIIKLESKETRYQYIDEYNIENDVEAQTAIPTGTHIYKTITIKGENIPNSDITITATHSELSEDPHFKIERLNGANWELITEIQGNLSSYKVATVDASGSIDEQYRLSAWQTKAVPAGQTRTITSTVSAMQSAILFDSKVVTFKFN